jgi:hypothetical protein
VALFKSYFGGAFDEDAIRNNFVLIYELLDGNAASCFLLRSLLQWIFLCLYTVFDTVQRLWILVILKICHLKS